GHGHAGGVTGTGVVDRDRVADRVAGIGRGVIGDLVDGQVRAVDGDALGTRARAGAVGRGEAGRVVVGGTAGEVGGRADVDRQGGARRHRHRLARQGQGLGAV